MLLHLNEVIFHLILFLMEDRQAKDLGLRLYAL